MIESFCDAAFMLAVGMVLLSEYRKNPDDKDALRGVAVLVMAASLVCECVLHICGAK